MSTSSSTPQTKRSTISPDSQVSRSPLVIGETSLLAIALVRIFVGYLWFQQIFWKLPPTFGGLHTYVVREVKGTFIPGYGAVVQNVFLANFGLLGTFTFTSELLIGLSLMLGIFSRAGALLATIMALQLYIGLSNTEWYWTYGMLVLLGFVLLPLPTGRRLGIDQWLSVRLQTLAVNNRFARWLSWFA